MGPITQLPKTAVYSLTKSLALEFAPYRIRVNAIGPGPIYTPLIRAGHTQAEWEEALRGFESRLQTFLENNSDISLGYVTSIPRQLDGSEILKWLDRGFYHLLFTHGGETLRWRKRA